MLVKVQVWRLVRLPRKRPRLLATLELRNVPRVGECLYIEGLDNPDKEYGERGEHERLFQIKQIVHVVGPSLFAIVAVIPISALFLDLVEEGSLRSGRQFMEKAQALITSTKGPSDGAPRRKRSTKGR